MHKKIKSSFYLEPELDKEMRIEAAKKGLRFPSEYIVQMHNKRKEADIYKAKYHIWLARGYEEVGQPGEARKHFKIVEELLGVEKAGKMLREEELFHPKMKFTELK